MNEFRDTVARFREAMHAEGERSARPRLEAMLHRERAGNGRAGKLLRLRWATAAAVFLLAIGAIPVYQNEQKKHEAAQEEADRALLEQVNAGLSRSVSPAMAPLMGFGQ